ncbi:hypothetical protein BY458DRAFT_437586 [Sporodiniella umbellata]|nr:hypothetical protein BY458DRAFT_437586 [Sporodiniella umbellata]
MSNKYNVIVDMEDAAFTQPATIESDGLEFQDFSANTGTNKSQGPLPLLPETSATSSSTGRGSGKPIWSIEYYSTYFDVDTAQVIERCLKSMYPVGDFAADTLQNQPDLYGPFWIATSVVFSVFVFSSLAGSLAAHIYDQEYVYNFTLLSSAVAVIYTYALLCPILVWASAKYFGCQPSLLEIINYYGYSLTIWIPVSSKRQQKILERERQEVESRKKSASIYVNQAPFRYCERNFKSRMPPPDYTHVVDLSDLPGKHTQENLDRIVPVKLSKDLSQLSPLFGDHSCQEAFVLKNVPGLIIIPNAFTPQAQIHLIKQCLSVYPRPPNTSNLDTHYVIPSTGLWPLYEKENSGELTMKDPEFFVAKKRSQDVEEGYSDSETEKEPSGRKLTACSDDFQPVINEPKRDPPPASTVPLLPPSELIRKLRWVTLGYQYHWPTKTYHLDRQYPFPKDVSEFTKAVVHAIEDVGYDDGQGQAWKNTYKGDDFIAEAGVINYYQYRDTLMGHVDRSELNMEAPLVSLRDSTYTVTFKKWGSHCHDWRL